MKGLKWTFTSHYLNCKKRREGDKERKRQEEKNTELDSAERERVRYIERLFFPD